MFDIKYHVTTLQLHCLCPRFLADSTYAAVDEVKDALADQECIFLHEMPPALSPLRRVCDFAPKVSPENSCSPSDTLHIIIYTK